MLRLRRILDHSRTRVTKPRSPSGSDFRSSLARGWESAKAAEIFGADLRSLAALRIVLAIIVLIDLAGRVPNLTVHYSDKGVLPRELLIEDLSSWRWSLYLANGEVFFQAVLFIITALAALAMLVGYRTRLMTVLVWVLVVSIQVRNPLVLSAADTLLRLLLFWAMFLPLGAWWSIDQKLKATTQRWSTRFLSLATVGLFLQISFMYWFTAALKTSPEWREDGTALYYALGAGQITTAFGEYLHQFSTLLKVLTFASIGLEIIAPILLFSPFFTGPVRTFAAASLMAFHFGIFLTMDIGIFPWTSAFCMVCFLPSWFWDTALPRLRAALPEQVRMRFSEARRRWDTVARPAHAFWDPLRARFATSALGNGGRLSLSGVAAVTDAYPLGSHATPPGSPPPPAPPSENGAESALPRLRSAPITNLLAVFFLVFIFGWNYTSVSDFRMPGEARPIGYGLALYQKWNMFAPRPPASTSWYLVRGALEDRRQVDLLTPIIYDDLDRIREISWQQPDNIAGDHYKDKYWRKYLAQIARSGNSAERREFAAYVCRTWNAHHTGSSELIGLQIVTMRTRTLPDYEPARLERDVLAEYRCV